MIQKAVDKFKEIPKGSSLGLIGLGVLAAYLYLRRKPEVWTKDNKLQICLEDLLATKDPDYIKKIVITESKYCQGDVRKLMIEIVKKLLAKNEITVLVNCSPQKFLRSGSQFFVNNVQQRSKKNVPFYYCALRTQLLVQKTIIDIDAINRKDQKKPVVMFCDNNSMDVKIAANTWRWDDFISQYKIDEKLLKNNYHLIIHAQSNGENEESAKDDKLIRDCWADHPNYHTIKQEDESQKVKQQQAMKGLKIIQDYLKQFLGPDFQWRVEQVDKIMHQ